MGNILRFPSGARETSRTARSLGASKQLSGLAENWHDSMFINLLY